MNSRPRFMLTGMKPNSAAASRNAAAAVKNAPENAAMMQKPHIAAAADPDANPFAPSMKL